MNKEHLVIYFHTLRHLKRIQIWYQIFYRVRPFFGQKIYNAIPSEIRQLTFCPGIASPHTFSSNVSFCFLNKQKVFNKIDWNYDEYGKLWTYNLNYFDFLLQDNIDPALALDLMRQYLADSSSRKDGIEPYPTSVRGVNWIKFLSIHDKVDSDLSTLLFQDYCRLLDRLEYHLLGNHLLENGLSLLFASLYFKDKNFERTARQILSAELKEQILGDGAHFELSPMYHQIILYRILDAYNLLENNSHPFSEIHSLLEKSAKKMLGWLQAISWKDGSIPLVNDSSLGIAPSTDQLLQYAARLGINSEDSVLRISGFRKYNQGDFEVLFDACQVMPAYQPGHTHADTLQVLLRHKDKNILVDTGISTYEKNSRRQKERSTASHNTITVDGRNSTQVWGGFRVGKRAAVNVIEESDHGLIAIHNGYSLIHHREILIQSEKVIIKDKFDGPLKGKKTTGHLHFPPNCILKKNKHSIVVEGLNFNFTNISSLNISECLLSYEFNKLEKGSKVTYEFREDCEVTIKPVKQ